MSSKASLFAIAALAIFAVGSSAHAALADLMTCQLSQGGAVRFTSDAQGRIDMEFDATAASQMGVRQVSQIQANMEAEDSGSTDGAIELIEIGSSASGGPKTTCSAAFWLQTKNMLGPIQTFGANRSIPLASHTGYNWVGCEKSEQKVLSCTAGKSLSSVSSLKMFLVNELGD